jgi:hypothetical protein
VKYVAAQAVPGDLVLYDMSGIVFDHYHTGPIWKGRTFAPIRMTGLSSNFWQGIETD